MIKKLVAKLLGKYVKGIVLKAIDAAQLALVAAAPGDVEKARAELCRKIQDQHKVPGEFRRIACWYVQDTTAADVNTLLSRLETAVSAL